MIMDVAPFEEQVLVVERELNALGEDINALGVLASKSEETFVSQDELLGNLANQSSTQRKLSDDIYEQRILNVLGPAIATHISNRTEIKIFKLDELGYRGVIAKVKLFDPKAFRVTLGKGKLGELETTSAAAKRNGAILAINGGGFYTEQRNGKPYARLIGNTVIGGKLVEPFNGYPGDLFFAGINHAGQVVGNVPTSERELMQLNPYMGVSFIPILLQNGKKVEIPAKWMTTKQPRTMIGQYANDDLIFIVIDGRQNDWSVGITLENLQDKLLDLGVKSAYNLDGGGSSAMYYNGKLLNKPSEGKERPVVNNIVILP
jgi:exopolysaccharide biosynthesis protein